MHQSTVFVVSDILQYFKRRCYVDRYVYFIPARGDSEMHGNRSSFVFGQFVCVNNSLNWCSSFQASRIPCQVASLSAVFSAFCMLCWWSGPKRAIHLDIAQLSWFIYRQFWSTQTSLLICKWTFGAAWRHKRCCVVHCRCRHSRFVSDKNRSPIASYRWSRYCLSLRFHFITVGTHPATLHSCRVHHLEKTRYMSERHRSRCVQTCWYFEQLWCSEVLSPFRKAVCNWDRRVFKVIN